MDEYEYQAMGEDRSVDIEDTIKAQASLGWRFVQALLTPGGEFKYLLIFERPKAKEAIKP